MSDPTDGDNVVPPNPPAENPTPAETPVPESQAAPPPGANAEPQPAPAPGSEPGAADAGPAVGAAPAEEPQPEPKPETLTDAIADLLQMAVNYLRQETAGVMRDKVVLPGQQLGMLVAFALAAASLLFLGIGFIAVGALILLAQYVGWPAALAIVGVLLLIGAAVFTYLKVRSIQK
jgi:hypothetical protein